MKLDARRLTYAAMIAVAAAAGVLYLRSDRLPELTPDSLDAARAAWQAAGIRSYDLTLVMSGTELSSGEYRVQVRDGEARTIVRDGIAVTGSGEAYTIDGLLKLLGQELVLAETPQRSYGAPAGYRAYLFARFEGERGLPLRFRRVVGGTSRWAEWSIEGLSSVEETRNRE